MYNYPKIVKRQGSSAIEENTTASPKTSSLPQPSKAIELPEAPSPEQSIESVEVPIEAEHWEALDVQPSNSSLLSIWQQELREIVWEHENDIWESWLYD